MNSFEILLENKKKRYYHNLALFLIALNVAVFAILSFYTTEKWIFGHCIAAIVVIVTVSAIEWYAQKRKRSFPAVNVALFYAMFAWLMMQYWWPAAISLLLWLFYNISNRPLLVSFWEKGILYPSFPKRTVSWGELNNAILKDDLLTIDFKNNKILQQLIEKTAKPVDEKEFNDFCRIQLRSAKN